MIWNPSDNGFPTKENSNYDGGYYPVIDYGGYSGFYDSPWWFYITQPVSSVSSNNNDPNGTVMRGSYGGRGSITRSPWIGITTGTPSRNTSTQTGNVSKSSTNSNNSNTRSGTGSSSQNSTNSKNSNGSRNSSNGRGR